MWLLLLMIFIMPFEKSPYFYISPSFAGLITDFTVIKALGMIGFVWALFRIANRDVAEPIFGSVQARVFGVLFIGILFSAALNDSALFAITKWAVFVTFLPFVLVTVRSENDLRRALYTAVIALTIIFPYALRQSGRYDARLGVGLYEPNYLAANLVLVIPLAFAIAGEQRTRGRRLLWACFGLVLVVSVFLTASRGGFLGLLAAGMVFAYRRLGVKGAVAVLLLLLAAVLPTDLGERTVGTLSRDANTVAGLEESNRAHTALFWAGLRMIVDAPIFGVGPQRFKDYSQLYSGLDVAYIAHNTYLELAAEAGVPVLILFLLLLATAIVMLARVARLRHAPETRSLGMWADGLLTGLVGFSVCAGFISAQYEKFFWLLLFLSIVIGNMAARKTAPAVAKDGLAPLPTAVRA